MCLHQRLNKTSSSQPVYEHDLASSSDKIGEQDCCELNEELYQRAASFLDSLNFEIVYPEPPRKIISIVQIHFKETSHNQIIENSVESRSVTTSEPPMKIETSFDLKP